MASEAKSAGSSPAGGTQPKNETGFYGTWSRFFCVVHSFLCRKYVPYCPREKLLYFAKNNRRHSLPLGVYTAVRLSSACLRLCGQAAGKLLDGGGGQRDIYQVFDLIHIQG